MAPPDDRYEKFPRSCRLITGIRKSPPSRGEWPSASPSAPRRLLKPRDSMLPLTKITLLPLLLIPAAPLWAQKQLYTYVGESNQLRLGEELRPAGLVNPGPHPDFLIGVPKGDFLGQATGEVRLYSGQTGALIRTIHGSAAGEEFGYSAIGLGDIDGDGRSDVLVGAPEAGGDGRVAVHSGLDGSEIYSIGAFSSLDNFGEDVDRLEDLDGDGRSDFVVGASNDNSGGLGTPGAIHVFSGATGTLLFSRYGENTLDSFGVACRNAGDVNGDGRSDILVGAYRDDDNGSMSGVVHMISGFDGTTLWKRGGLNVGDEYGGVLDAAGLDMNGDSIPDVIVGTMDEDYMHVLSGVDGSLIRSHDGSATSGGCATFGRGLCALNDIDGDGFGDYAAGDQCAMGLGQVIVYSGATGAVLYDPNFTDQAFGFGTTLGNVGDLNLDGRDEWGIQAFGWDTLTTGNVGRVTIHSAQAPIGSRFCDPAVIGSSGVPAEIQVYGSPQVSENCMSLTVSGVPTGSFGYFVGGNSTIAITPPGSIGTLCVSGLILRFNRFDEIIRGPQGSLQIDLQSVPMNPSGPILPGETWNFQCWFRDFTPGGMQTSNFSDAVTIQFL